MATKHISDKQVVEAYIQAKKQHREFTIKYPHQILQQMTGECEKVCWAACKRAYRRDFIECGVSLRTGWVTDKGLELLK